MTRSRLQNRYLKHRKESKEQNYTKQQNYCVSLLKKVKKNYNIILNEKTVPDNKVLKTVKSLFR